jgi:hypothetical protein
MLRERGFVATSGPATVRTADGGGDTTPLPHKTVATRAGLGWIGHCALLVTPAFGPALRISSVLTNAPRYHAVPIVRSRCGTCRRCVEVFEPASPGPSNGGKSRHAALRARDRGRNAAAGQGSPTLKKPLRFAYGHHTRAVQNNDFQWNCWSHPFFLGSPRNRWSHPTISGSPRKEHASQTGVQRGGVGP